MTLLDPLEALDADRITALVDYFSEFADCLVIAPLPEDAAALGGDHQHVIDIYPSHPHADRGSPLR